MAAVSKRPMNNAMQKTGDHYNDSKSKEQVVCEQAAVPQVTEILLTSFQEETGIPIPIDQIKKV